MTSLSVYFCSTQKPKKSFVGLTAERLKFQLAFGTGFHLDSSLLSNPGVAFASSARWLEGYRIGASPASQGAERPGVPVPFVAAWRPRQQKKDDHRGAAARRILSTTGKYRNELPARDMSLGRQPSPHPAEPP